MTITEAFRAYGSDVIAFKNQSPKTEENHYVAMRSLIAYLGDIEIDVLNFNMVRDWKQELDKTRSPETVRNYIIKLRIVLIYLKSRGYEVLDAALVPVPKRRDKVPLYLTPDEVTRCIDATARVKNKLIVALLYASGIRISELCALNRGQGRDGCFTVIGKGGKARICFYDDRVKWYSKLYYETRNDNNPAAFLSDSGHRITPGAIQETFKTIRKQTGLNVHPHSLRHSFATNLLTTNTNLFHVSRMLGHSQLSTTQQYLHVVDADLKQIYNNHHTI